MITMSKDLFGNETGEPAAPETGTAEARHIPLADRMRPASLDEVLGQQELLGPRGALRLLLDSDSLPSLLLWGPPGCARPPWPGCWPGTPGPVSSSTAPSRWAPRN